MELIQGSYIGNVHAFRGAPVFPHGMRGIFVSGSASIGKRCVIFQQVTIGSNTIPFSKGLGAPVVGDDCYIGAGAKIIGNVHIGNNCRIGANAVVTFDVPDNSVVVSQQPRVIAKDAMDNGYYSCGSGGWEKSSGMETEKVIDEAILEELKRFP